MTKRFEWCRVRRPESTDSHVCLIEIDDTRKAFFWAALTEIGELYHPIVLDKDRKRYWHIMENLPLKECKDAVEEELCNLGVIEDGDTIIDRTE